MSKDGQEFRGQHKVTFLAHRNEISSYIQKGYSLVHIKRMIPELESMSYQTLARHANTYCFDDHCLSARQKQSDREASALPTQREPIDTAERLRRPKKFEYKPSDGDLNKFVSDD